MATRTKTVAKRKLSEAQAWRELARQWDRAKESTYGPWEARVGDYGLCGSIDSLTFDGRVLPKVDVSMLKRLYKCKPKNAGVYFWPIDKGGAKERAAFCRRMAKLATKKKGGS